MSSLEPREQSNEYWRSLDELADAPEFRAFLEAEFPAAAGSASVSRRRWLQLMGASLTLAGMAGCRWEKAEILPFAKRPENRVPGKPQKFVTAIELDGSAVGLLVTSIDGRPIKIEGNPKHPASLGATDVLAQAAILELYDPDRSRKIVETTPEGERVRNWDELAEQLRSRRTAAEKNGGAGLRVLSQSNSSPTLAALRQRLLKQLPQAKWYEYDPLSRDEEREGAKLAFGQPCRTHLALDKAEIVVCLDADLFGEHPDRVRLMREFAAGRAPEAGAMKRLYSIESVYSLTGAMADHRLPLTPSRIGRVVGRLAEVLNSGKDSKDSKHSKDEGWEAKFLLALADDLRAHRGRCIVVAGPGQPAAVHAEVHRINAALENSGKTVWYSADPDRGRPSHAEAIKAIVADLRGGHVETLLILDGNPVYDAPADLEFASALEKAPTSIHLGAYRNETSLRCMWHVPQAHFLESWGDSRGGDGTYSVVQPLIEPLHGGKSAIELVAAVLGETSSAYELVRETFREIAGEPSWKDRWDKTLHDGLLDNSRWPAETPALVAGGKAAEESRSNEGELEIIFGRDATVHDGRFANNAWLQELPDPMSKLTWDNAALISPATAKSMGVEHGTIVRLKYDGREVEIPVYVMPGQAAGCVAVSLGYGRSAAGHVGGIEAENIAAVGVNVYPLRTSGAMHFGAGLTVESTGRKYPLATTQDHFAIDRVGFEAREKRIGVLVREGTLDEYQKDPKFVEHSAHVPELDSLWQEPKYEGHRWGMTIDLSRCIGCNACVVACQAENNVPVVGKERVLRGREMHWIRIDRYFRGEPDDPASMSSVHQPVACHHCENAPCEQVCPVAATVHSGEGLNEMVYNRCVGTRYCANNCPYKVRRFNFFNYHKDLEDADNEVLKMVYNPEVTVRSRGVMEKCTFCVQRIQAAKIDAKNQRRPLEDGEITSACQQVCPAQAIVFGDLGPHVGESSVTEPLTAVAKAAALPRAYQMLAELNVKPRTTYLARVRNPNPELESAHEHASS